MREAGINPGSAIMVTAWTAFETEASHQSGDRLLAWSRFIRAIRQIWSEAAVRAWPATANQTAPMRFAASQFGSGADPGSPFQN